MGLPGSGKTTLAKALQEKLEYAWFNADEIREQFNDWDFSEEGRIRQANRMKWFADNINKSSICDFVAPTEEIRNIFDADFTIWMNTIKTSIYNDTNSVFVPPKEVDMEITDFNYSLSDIINRLTNEQATK